MAWKWRIKETSLYEYYLKRLITNLASLSFSYFCRSITDHSLSRIVSYSSLWRSHFVLCDLAHPWNYLSWKFIIATIRFGTFPRCSVHPRSFVKLINIVVIIIVVGFTVNEHHQHHRHHPPHHNRRAENTKLRMTTLLQYGNLYGFPHSIVFQLRAFICVL